MRSVLGLALLGIVSVTACSAVDDDGGESSEAYVSTGVLGGIVEDLRVRHPREENKTWTISRKNALPPSGILEMPAAAAWGKPQLTGPRACGASDTCESDFGTPMCNSVRDCGGGPCTALEATKQFDGDQPRKICTGHSDYVLDEIYRVMTSAHRTLDITSLSPPRGRFLAAMRNALSTLSSRNEPVVVRFLFGEFPGGGAVDVPGTLRELTRDIGTNSRLTVSVAAHRNGIVKWNHSKIIAADGKEVIVGGMNLWEDHYLDANPVHDVSLHLSGGVATASQQFANELWESACSRGEVETYRQGRVCPPAFRAGQTTAPGDIDLLAIGRLGTSRDATKTALASMMDYAQHHILISQQDIGSYRIAGGGVLVEDYVDAWLRAVRRGVDVDIVLSNEGARGGEGNDAADSYANGWSEDELWRMIIQRQEEIWPDAKQALCEHLHLQRLRTGQHATWAGGRPYANHAKVVIVDDHTFYVGSQNLYDANLAEYGVIINDVRATRRFTDEYFSKFASYARATTYVNPSCR